MDIRAAAERYRRGVGLACFRFVTATEEIAMTSAQENALAAFYLSRSIVKTLLARDVIEPSEAAEIWDQAIKECQKDGPTLDQNIGAADLMAAARTADLAKR